MEVFDRELDKGCGCDCVAIGYCDIDSVVWIRAGDDWCCRCDEMVGCGRVGYEKRSGLGKSMVVCYFKSCMTRRPEISFLRREAGAVATHWILTCGFDFVAGGLAFAGAAVVVFVD